MKIRIRTTNPNRTLEFPYGHISKENSIWIKEHHGEMFEAIRHNMNYYLIPENGIKIHVYDATEIEK